MNLDELTLGQIKQLQCLLGQKESSVCCEQGQVKIVVLQRGWVFVGRYFKEGTACRLENSFVIRNWGTTQGLGEIAQLGPTPNTKLDPSGSIAFNELTAVVTMDCREEKWSDKCERV